MSTQFRNASVRARSVPANLVRNRTARVLALGIVVTLIGARDGIAASGTWTGGGGDGGITKTGPGTFCFDNANNASTGTREVREGEVCINVNNGFTGRPDLDERHVVAGR